MKDMKKVGEFTSLEYDIFGKECTLEEDNSIKARFLIGPEPQLEIKPKNGGVWDFSDDSVAFTFDVANSSSQVQRMAIILKDGSCEKSYQNYLEPYSTRTIYCVFNESLRDLGADTLPPPVKDDSQINGDGWHNNVKLDFSKVESVCFTHHGELVGYYTFENFRIERNPNYDPAVTYKNMVDQFGQYTKKEWKNKIHSKEELVEASRKECEINQRFVDENSKRSDRTKYGGYKKEELKQEVTGRFYTKKIGENWTLIDPDGYPYFATGMDIVRKDGTSTWVDGRNYMFSQIPEDLPGHYVELHNTVQPPTNTTKGRGYCFYTANLERIYGKDWLEKWAENSVQRFKAWGITSIGAWAEPSLFFGKGDQYKMPYTGFVWTRGEHTKLNDNTPDPFDPEYLTSVRNAVKNQANHYNIENDPYCFGVYVDNEFVWGMDVKKSPVVFSIFQTDVSCEKSFAKRHFIEVLKEKYKNIENLNQGWGTSIESFEQLGKPYSGEISPEDCGMVLHSVADKYYSIVSSVVGEQLPQVLYLGSRNTEFGTPREVITAAIKYVDVLSFNCYKPDIIRENFRFEEYDVPMIIGEFNFTATERGMFGLNVTSVNSSKDRADGYLGYVNSALRSGKFVGVHWFQYYDQPIFGRGWDGENTNTGFVDVTDQPYPDLVAVSQKLYNNMYETKFDYVPVTNIRVKERSINLEVWETKIITAATTPADVLADDIKYYSTNEYVVRVSEKGVVMAVGEGDATIHVKAANDLFVITSFNVTVGAGGGRPAAVIRFSDTVKNTKVALGKTVNLKDRLVTENLTSHSHLVFVSSKKSVGTVDENGLFTTHSRGVINVVAKDQRGFAVDSIKVTVV